MSLISRTFSLPIDFVTSVFQIFGLSIDTITAVSQNSRLSKLLVSAPYVVVPQLFYLTPALPLFLVSNYPTLLLPILSLGNISVVTTTSPITDNLILLGIHICWCHLGMLVLGAQNQNSVELIALVDNF